MRSYEFFVEQVTAAAYPWDNDETTTAFDVDRVEKLIRQRDPHLSDLEIAIALVDLAHEEFEEYGTSGQTRITDDQSATVMKALGALARRLNISNFDPPFRDFRTFRTFWGRNNGHGSWQARREMVEEFFGPLRRTLDSRETQSLQSTLATAISPRPTVGWPAVDNEISEMRRHFESAVTEQDYSNVGNDAVAVVEALSRVIYQHSIHGGQP